MPYNAPMRATLLTRLRFPGWLAPALACALLLASVQDVGHEHAASAHEQPCYACHFSPDLGLAAASGVPAPVLVFGADAPVALAAALPAGAIAAYDARGPPLLS